MSQTFSPPTDSTQGPLTPSEAEDAQTRLSEIRKSIRKLQEEEIHLLRVLGYGKVLLVSGIRQETQPHPGGGPLHYGGVGISAKIETIKLLRELMRWDLKTAKDFAENLPGVLNVQANHPILQEMIRQGAVVQVVGDTNVPTAQGSPAT